MISKITNFFRMNKHIAIDLGTSNVLIYDKQKKLIVLNEPSVIVYNNRTKQVSAVGNEAREMLGKTPDSVTLIRPLENGVISDIDATRDMLEYFIKKIYGVSPFKPEVMICVPIEVNTVEKRALFDAIPSAKKVYIIEEGRAALLGSGVNISLPIGNMVIDIGGGSTDVAVLSLDELIVSRSIKVAGNTFDNDITKYLKEELHITVGNRLSEKIKKTLATAMPVTDEENETMVIVGKDNKTGIPKSIEITSNQVYSAITKSLNSIIDTAKEILHKCPPDLASDILENGIVLTGGGAMIKNLDNLITKETGIKVVIPDAPLESVVRGGGLAFDNKNLVETLLMKEN